LAGLCAIVGAYLVVKGMPTEIAAVEIENGTRPPIYNWKRSGTQKRNRYRVGGQLAATDPVAFDNHGASWLCAPLVSGRTDGDRRPRVFYAASETTFRRARADNRFAGELHSASAAFLHKPSYEATACGVPDDSYVLIDDGSSRTYLMLGRGALIIGGALGCLAAIAFVIERRRAARAPHPNPLPASRGEGT
jgi:hypothetical protein